MQREQRAKENRERGGGERERERDGQATNVANFYPGQNEIPLDQSFLPFVVDSTSSLKREKTCIIFKNKDRLLYGLAKDRHLTGYRVDALMRPTYTGWLQCKGAASFFLRAPAYVCVCG